MLNHPVLVHAMQHLFGWINAQAEQFSYCQPWMLAWGYRKQNLIAELVSYNADIMCLQV